MTHVPQMAQASVRHIDNHASWGRARRDFIAHTLLNRDGATGALLGCRSLWADTRQVEPLHAPLLIEDTAHSVLAHARPYATTVV